MRQSFYALLTALCAMLPASAVLADPPVIEGAQYSNGMLSVTLRHADTGWDHYADAWEVLAPDGSSLGIRELAHPHVNEQPFTRSLRVDLGADVPAEITLRARCNVTGWSEPVVIALD